MPGPGNTPYVVRAQLPQYWSAAAFNGTTSSQQDQACIDATSEVDSYLRGRYQMPLLSWGADLVKYTAWIAIYQLLTGARGMGQAAGQDQTILLRYYEAVGNPNVPGSMGWLQKVQRQSIHPDITATVPPQQDPTFGLPQVFTSPQRGWQLNVNGKPVV